MAAGCGKRGVFFPLAPEPFIDLSTGINPLPYPVPPLDTETWTRLPEPEGVAALEAMAAKAYGVVNAAMVAAAPGTQILISLLPRLFPQNSVAILGPTYGEYARAFAAAGSEVVQVNASSSILPGCASGYRAAKRRGSDWLARLLKPWRGGAQRFARHRN
jgi:cobalamin biosynthesis protein CobC